MTHFISRNVLFYMISCMENKCAKYVCKNVAKTAHSTVKIPPACIGKCAGNAAARIWFYCWVPVHSFHAPLHPCELNTVLQLQPTQSSNVLQLNILYIHTHTYTHTLSVAGGRGAGGRRQICSMMAHVKRNRTPPKPTPTLDKKFMEKIKQYVSFLNLEF